MSGVRRNTYFMMAMLASLVPAAFVIWLMWVIQGLMRGTWVTDVPGIVIILIFGLPTSVSLALVARYYVLVALGRCSPSEFQEAMHQDPWLLRSLKMLRLLRALPLIVLGLGGAALALSRHRPVELILWLPLTLGGVALFARSWTSR